MLFELATPTRMLISADVEEVVAPGTEGYFGVWPGHAAFLTTLGSGEVCYRTGRNEKCLAVSGGFAEVGPTHVTILAESAERPEEIDVARARVAGERAEQRLRAAATEETDVDRALGSFARARARLQTAGRRPGGA